VVGLVLVLPAVAIGLVAVVYLLVNDPAIIPLKNGGQTTATGWVRWGYVGLVALLAFAMPGIGLLSTRMPRLEIFASRFVFSRDRRGRRSVPWDSVVHCEWKPRARSVLEIQLRNERDVAKVPPEHAAQVEETIRRLGKWREGN
jgi:hypothetical protein